MNALLSLMMASLLVLGVGSFGVMADSGSGKFDSGKGVVITDENNFEDALDNVDDETEIKLEVKNEGGVVSSEGLNVLNPDAKKEFKLEVKTEDDNDFDAFDSLDNEVKLKVESKTSDTVFVDENGAIVLDPDFKKEVKIEFKSEGVAMDSDFMMKLHDLLMNMFH